MQFIGHTMGTPGKGVAESASLFAAMGMDGTELICREGTGFAADVPAATALAVAESARQQGAPIVALTPYAWEFNSAEPGRAASDTALLRRSIDLAAHMGARFVRAYGGKAGEGDLAESAFQRAVAGLRSLGGYAAGKGVTLLVENHPGTLTRTGADTRRLVDGVGLSSVRALYDPANVMYDTREPWEHTLEVQKGTIGYVHVKDYRMEGNTRRACCVGEGVVPWPQILARLVAWGYDGCLSFEYEKKWYPADLPEPEVGMKRSLDYVERVLGL